MKFGIMGAGAVGCYYAAVLAKLGHEVTCVGRPSFVEQVLARGLILESGGTTETLSVRASGDPAALAGAEVILFAVKSTATESAGLEMAPHVDFDATVLSFQNGVDNAPRLATILGRPVVPVAVYVATEMKGPGHVVHHGNGHIGMGPSSRDAAIQEIFAAAGLTARISEDVDQALWGKLIRNCCYNALSAVARRPYGVFADVPEMAALMESVAWECTLVARAAGVAMPDPDMDSVIGLGATMTGQYSSTAQDLMREKPTEIDFINGHVVRLGRELGVPTPANRALYVAVKLAETPLPQ